MATTRPAPRTPRVPRTPQEAERRHQLLAAASGDLGYGGPLSTSARPTYAQLHEQQCISCPQTSGLRPAGHRTVDGLVWPVVACAEHLGGAR